MAHSRLSPSGANRWVNCPGSVTMCERFPDYTRSEAADEGVASHYVGEQVLLHAIDPYRLIGTPCPDNGVIITDEMVDGAMVYVEAVRAACAANPPSRELMHVEKHMYIESVHSECHGTPDLRYFIPQTNTLYVDDYKYGWGIVEPYENYQLIIYAIGAIEELARMYKTGYGNMDQNITVVLRIIQPRPFHASGSVREWRVNGAALRGYLNRLTDAAHRALADSPECHTGQHCHYCRARHACPALQQAAMLSVDYTALAQPQELSPEAMAAELRILRRAAEMIDYRLKSLETRATMHVQAGGTLPGYTLQTGHGHMAWKMPVGQVLALGDMYGVDLRDVPKAITPAKAKGKLPAEVIATMTERPVTGLKLVESGKTLARIFGGATAQ